MRKGRIAALVVSFLVGTLCMSFPAPIVHAASPQASKGLSIMPVQQFLSAQAGKTTRSSFTVANYSTSAMTVDFYVQQFSVMDFSYTYTFAPTTNSWLHLGQTEATLYPGQTLSIPYTLTIPSNAPPGGRYYTLLASAKQTTQSITDTIQAADQVYVTVAGKLTIISHLESEHIERLVFGNTIPFTLNPIDTGNIYSFIYVSGQLHGLLVKPPETSAAHLLIPGKVRTLTSEITSPVFPGIYRATYGYKTTSGWVIQKTAWILYIPPWSIAFLLVILLIGNKLRTRRATRRKVPSTDVA
jgi:hypothetical protein